MKKKKKKKQIYKLRKMSQNLSGNGNDISMVYLPILLVLGLARIEYKYHSRVLTKRLNNIRFPFDVFIF